METVADQSILVVEVMKNKYISLLIHWV